MIDDPVTPVRATSRLRAVTFSPKGDPASIDWSATVVAAITCP
ncbi:hypothetical protein [Cryobacterium sp. 10C3]|nr:hypothetical protein [Cryobacterium sp. 10C3]MDY7555668.1 hypothetical protein [Cryobacterium sp. 10C3]